MEVCDPEGFLEMANCLLSLAPGLMDFAENSMAFAETMLIAILREVECTGRRFFCRVELSVFLQRPSEGD